MAFLIPSIIGGIGSLFSGIGASRAQAAKNQAKERQAAKIGDVANMLRSGSNYMPDFSRVKPINSSRFNVDAGRFNVQAPQLEDFQQLERRYDNANLDAAANRTLSRGRGALGVGMAGRGLSNSGMANSQYRQMTGDTLAGLSQQISQNDLARMGMAQQHGQFGASQRLQAGMANQQAGMQGAIANQSAGMQGAMANQNNLMQQIGMRQQQQQFGEGNRLNRAQAMASMYGHEGFATPEADPWGTAFSAIGGTGQAVGGGMMSMMPYIPPGQGWWGGGQPQVQAPAPWQQIPIGGQGYRR